jgi:hypothetical protein
MMRRTKSKKVSTEQFAICCIAGLHPADCSDLPNDAARKIEDRKIEVSQ